MTRDRRLGRGLAALLGTPLEPEIIAPPPAPPPVFPSAPASASLHPTMNLAASPQGGSPQGTLGGFSPIEAGLDLASPPALAGLAHDSTAAGDSGSLLQLPVAEIEENPFQPRRDFSDAEIVSLSESLKEHDLLQPILVRRVAGRYQLISGERRLRAARHAGWATIPARLREADDRLVAELAIVENLQRKDLNPVEKALSFKRYLDEHDCTQDDLARRLKIDRSTIANLMRLLELPSTILDSLRQGGLTAGHARALLPLGDEREQIALADRIKEEGLSVRDVERTVAARLGAEQGEEPATLPHPAKGQRQTSEQLAALEQEIRHAMGAKIDITANARGRGKVVIHFANHEEFERIREHLTAGRLSVVHGEAA